MLLTPISAFMPTASVTGGAFVIASNIVSGQTGGTTNGVDTSGATLLVICMSFFGGLNPVISDSKGNTYTALTPYSGSQILYCFSPTIGAGHTATASASGNIYASIQLIAFSGVTAFDVANGNAASASPGSITSATSNNVVVTCCGGQGDPSSVDSGFTLIDHQLGVPGQYVCLGTAYKLNISGSIGPTWTGATGPSSSIAAFK